MGKITANNELFKIEDFETSRINFGRVKVGSIHTFKVTFEDCVFIKTGRSCGCIEPEVIHIDNGFEVNIKFQPKVKSPKITQYINIYHTSEGKTIEFRIYLNATTS